MDVMSAIQSVTAGLVLVKELQDINRSVDEASFKLKIVELSSALADAKIALVTSSEEIIEKNKEIQNLKKSFEWKGTLIEKHGYLYEDNGNGEPQGRPFCPRCCSKDAFLIRLERKQAISHRICPECKAEYKGVEDYSYPDE